MKAKVPSTHATIMTEPNVNRFLKLFSLTMLD